ncbi:hypothetical protein AAFF_G00362550 [Aldrovandia affinis]|uniref:Uncharacterized protein n=1 Tax=Aldrovandia affinis TaxID=143900 RepID=A0AAD7WMX4_9TELE|nr:hypothetical protein AAFF_G00362550 [Aldrovandia affinis]
MYLSDRGGSTTEFRTTNEVTTAQEVSSARSLFRDFPILMAKVSAVAKLPLPPPPPPLVVQLLGFFYKKPCYKCAMHPSPACPSVYGFHGALHTLPKAPVPLTRQSQW